MCAIMSGLKPSLKTEFYSPQFYLLEAPAFFGGSSSVLMSKDEGDLPCLSHLAASWVLLTSHTQPDCGSMKVRPQSSTGCLVSSCRGYSRVTTVLQVFTVFSAFETIQIWGRRGSLGTGTRLTEAWVVFLAVEQWLPQKHCLGRAFPCLLPHTPAILS